MKTRPSQLALRLDAAPPDDRRWHDGAPLTYLGGLLTLRLDTSRREAMREGDVLHLPLPPEASARQVQDAAEAWQRAQALRVISALVTIEARRQGGVVPNLSLSFAARSHWAQVDENGGLRFHWRLIEQPEGVLRQVVARALAARPAAASLDLFAPA